MTLLIILGSLCLIIFLMFYIGYSKENNELQDNMKKHTANHDKLDEVLSKADELAATLAAHKVNPTTLSTRAEKCIKGLHIVYVHDLEAVTVRKLEAVKGVGQKTIDEIDFWAATNYDITIR